MEFRARSSRAFDWLLDACARVACWLILFQVVSITLDVLVRSFLDISLAWVTALNEWSLVIIAFLGAAWLQREDGHTRDDSLIAPLGPTVLRVSRLIGLLMGVAVCLFLIWFGFKKTWEAYVGDLYDFFKLRDVPIFWVYLFIPFGSVLWLIQLFRRNRPQPTD